MAQAFDFQNFIQDKMVKLTEWSSSLCRSALKDSNKI
jgi:hypothetical protein